MSLALALRPALLLVVAMAVSAPAHAGGAARPALSVFAAASLAAPFRELGRAFEMAHPGLRIRFNFAGSQQLATQIEQGAQADVFVSADPRWMDHVARRAMLSGAPRILAGNRLAVIVPSSNPARILALEDLARPGVKLVLGAESVPVGAYSRELLRRLGRTPGYPADFGSKVLRNLVSEEENVEQVRAKVELGEADAGVVYRSDLAGPAGRSLQALDVPAAANVPARYPMAVLRDAPSPALGEAFMSWLLSPGPQRVLRRYGFLPAAEATHG